MSPGTDSLEARAAELRELHERAARAQLATADESLPGSDKVAYRGCLLAEVALVKGLPGPAEHAGGAAVSGPDGVALAAALEALGHDAEAAFYLLSQPETGSRESIAQRLRLALEAVDAPVVVALDAVAARDVAEAYALDPLVPGEARDASGRRFVAVDGFEESLEDERAKRRVWAQLQAARPLDAVY